MILTLSTDKEGKEGSEDTYYIRLLKQTREKMDEWLKSLNERIDQEDITRFEVRFYEISRNIVEWIREMIDAKVKSSEEKKLKKKEKERLLLDTRQGIFLPFDKA
jgi:acyl-ACP thioesterase